LLPTGVPGKPRVDDRRVLSEIVHAFRCCGRWVGFADVYGRKKTLYNRFVRWSERGIWEDSNSRSFIAAPLPPVNQSAIADATI
jgi:transposase